MEVPSSKDEGGRGFSGAGEEGGGLVPHQRFLRRLARENGSRTRLVRLIGKTSSAGSPQMMLGCFQP